jgi:predicted nucleic acid-binding protein
MVVDASVWVAALDPGDPFRPVAIAFLTAATAAAVEFAGPATMVVEIACAMARKTGDPEVGIRAYHELMDNADLSLHPLDPSLLDLALQLGAGLGLRSGDALYAAVARRRSVPLVSWDRELLERAGAVTPEEWLARAPAQS